MSFEGITIKTRWFTHLKYKKLTFPTQMSINLWCCWKAIPTWNNQVMYPSGDDFSLNSDLTDHSVHVYLRSNCSSNNEVWLQWWYHRMVGFHSKMLKNFNNLRIHRWMSWKESKQAESFINLGWMSFTHSFILATFIHESPWNPCFPLWAALVPNL